MSFAGPTFTGEPAPLTEPADGTPAVTDTVADYEAYLTLLEAGSGPVAVDAERASGFKYGQDAYLVQVRREGAGTALIDPRAVTDLSGIARVTAGDEWVFHAASQDLPCLRDVGMVPGRIFDTELAGRLLNKPRVGLGTLVAGELGLTLAKEHSAADWSKRPLPQSWLRYAALDVEVLVELRDVLADQLRQAGKAEWARQEFEHELNSPGPAARVEPWRRTSKSAALKDRRQLAIVRSMWQARDAVAQEADIAPGRILPDAAIIAAATTEASSLSTLRAFQGRGGQRRIRTWQRAFDEAVHLPESDLPARRAPLVNSMPQPRSWRDRAPEAHTRLEAIKRVVRTRGIEIEVPQENLLAPDAQRRIAWHPPTIDGLAERLTEIGVRPWQIENVGDMLADALRNPQHIIDTVPDPLAEANNTRNGEAAGASKEPASHTPRR